MEQIISRAITLANTGRIQEAVNSIKGILRNSPENGLAHYVLGSLYLQQGNLNNALTNLTKAKGLGLHGQDLSYKLGTIYYRQSKYRESLDILTDCMASDSNHTEAIHMALRCSLYLNELHLTRELGKRYFGPISKTTIEYRISRFIRLVHDLRHNGYPIIYRTIRELAIIADLDDEDFSTPALELLERPILALTDNINSFCLRHNGNQNSIKTILLKIIFIASLLDTFNNKIPPIPDSLLSIEEFHFAMSFHDMAYIIPIILGYNISSPTSWNKFLYYSYIKPQIIKELTDGEPLIACALESLTQFSIAQQPSTAEQVAKIHYELSPYFTAYGSSINEISKQKVIQCSNIIRIAFFSELVVDNSSPLQLIHSIIESIRHLENIHETKYKFEFAIISWQEFDLKPHNNFFSSLDVRIIDLKAIRGTPAIGPAGFDVFVDRFTETRNQLVKAGYDIIIYGNAYDNTSCLFAAAKLAPIQIYLSMAFRYLRPQIFDCNIAVGGVGERDQVIEDEILWNLIPVTRRDELDYPNHSIISKEASSIKRRFGNYNVILGTLSRPQKILNNTFLDTLAIILNRNPNAIYFWYGEQELDQLRVQMEMRGISERCIFQGWVNPKVHARVLDIHLDAFPFPGGFSIYDTMDASRAAVLYDCLESRQTGMVRGILPIIEGTAGSKQDHIDILNIFTDADCNNLLCIAKSPDEYISLVQKLIDDSHYRYKVGQALRCFQERFTHDKGRMGRSFLRILQDTLIQIGKISPKDELLITK